ncbi:hypothetical protein ACFYWU_34055 [Streptomyces chrestomyceticus]|uniref:hypothetical protein n=1 Tax=Streptomyces chrestomyceticus TaxID=68185 RepID=UPI0036AF448E
MSTGPDTNEPRYEGPDPFLHGVTAKWAAYLETLPPVPRTIDAVLTKLPASFRAQAWMEIGAAEGEALLKALARWWRMAIQMPTDEQVRQQIADIESGKLATVPAEEIFPELVEQRAAWEARSEAEKQADREQMWREREERDEERNELSRHYLEQLEGLAAAERSVITHMNADRERHRPTPPA